MADDADDQDYFGGLAQDLLGKSGLLQSNVPGLGANLTGVPAISTVSNPSANIQPAMAPRAPTGNYVTVSYYKGLGPDSILNQGHLGLSLNGGPAYGLEPSPGIGSIPMIGYPPPRLLQTLTQLFGVVPGEMDMIPADRPVGDHVRFPVAGDQAQTIEQYQRNLAGPTLYNVPFKDCVTTVADTMKSAHLNTPSTLTNFTPAQFVRALHALYDKPAIPPQ